VDELTPDDVRHWDASLIQQMFQAAKGIDREHQKLGDTLDENHRRTTWHGESGDAFREELGKPRKDLEIDGTESKAVATAAENAEQDIKTCRDKMLDIYERAEDNGWSITPDWRVDDTNANDTGQTHDPQLLQNDLDQLKIKAHAADHELEVAIRAAVGDAQVDAQGHEVHRQPQTQESKATPADQLPLTPKDGQRPSPTEGTAGRHDHRELGGKDYLALNPSAAPLLAGLSADEWRQRLAHYSPGDPLPDPRTPTGDKAIDSLANAVGQQNATYAWGGNRSLTGPSQGHGDNGGDATKMDDLHRVGYDCGGLVRYSVQQGAGFDVGMGTGAIDSNSHFPHPKDLMQVPSAGVVGKAQPGDVLVFTKGTGHTGIYIGNGFMINAPDSGNPVRVDQVGPGRGPTDILRIPSR
jgi:hypothetical protein